ncbi:hypothetical protein IE53DRAFT_183710 [Violaceomyces palustris]|uniref:Uncharacterized protein n=1 Tax=Violaceomyces palustris TaxID=1673888 RepID=A0ACD0P5F3_9BASI|nr:hypothetical protein IE53DRAFT_183710 [Violaceomyces palustris]
MACGRSVSVTLIAHRLDRSSREFKSQGKGGDHKILSPFKVLVSSTILACLVAHLAPILSPPIFSKVQFPQASGIGGGGLKVRSFLDQQMVPARWRRNGASEFLLGIEEKSSCGWVKESGAQVKETGLKTTSQRD